MRDDIPDFGSQNDLHATTRTPFTTTGTLLTVPTTALPLDLQLDLAKRDSIRNRPDTVILHDTVRIVKYKIKYRAPKKPVEPDSLPTPAKPDTLFVPKLKISIQMSKDVLMDTTFTVIPDSVKCPHIQPLQEREE